MDDASAKAGIITLLEEHGVTFIDVGMGLHAVDGALLGALRVTSSTPERRDHIHAHKRIPLNGSADRAYATNIQIAELNALNAALAVIKWKKFCGFYADLDHELHSVYTIDGNHMLNEDHVGV
jgi:hypothetical protein